MILSAADLAELVAIAEGEMVDTCRITKPGEGRGPWNPDTGSYDPPEPITVYEGKCDVPARGSTVTRVNAGAESWSVGELPFSLPFTDQSAQVGPGMTVTYLTAPDNAALVGREFDIVEPLWGSRSTARRFRIKTAVGT